MGTVAGFVVFQDPQVNQMVSVIFTLGRWDAELIIDLLPLA